HAAPAALRLPRGLLLEARSQDLGPRDPGVHEDAVAGVGGRERAGDDLLPILAVALDVLDRRARPGADARAQLLLLLGHAARRARRLDALDLGLHLGAHVARHRR